jgi:hypothetical protein
VAYCQNILGFMYTRTKDVCCTLHTVASTNTIHTWLFYIINILGPKVLTLIFKKKASGGANDDQGMKIACNQSW